MAKKNELGITLKVKGGQQAKREIERLGDTIKSSGEKASGGSSGSASSGGGPSRSGMGGRGAQDVNVRGGPALGRLAGGAMLGQMASRAFSAMSSTIAQTFDANMTQFEKDLKIQQGIAQANPFGGDAAAAILGMNNQVSLGTIQGTAARANNTFGAAFSAIAAQNPNATNDELSAIFEKKLGPAVDSFINKMKELERGQELGSQFIAKRVDALTDLEVDGNAGTATEEVAAKAVSTAAEPIKKLLREIRDALIGERGAENAAAAAGPGMVVYNAFQKAMSGD